MSSDLEKILVELYPGLFKQYGGKPSETCMAWGIAVGDGWYPIVSGLCNGLEKIRRKTGRDIQFSQIKQKWGLLRVYLDNSCDEAERLVEAAESESSKWCEDCGCAGKTGTEGYIRTVCEECENGRK